jgi:hypothetical protein
LDVITILVLVAGILLGPGPMAAVVAFLFVIVGRAFIAGA